MSTEERRDIHSTVDFAHARQGYKTFCRFKKALRVGRLLTGEWLQK
jgi:hypothetical protein